jgi:hypothetical protein
LREEINKPQKFELFNLLPQLNSEINENEYLYHNSTHSIEQFKLTIALFAARFNLSDVCLKELLKLLKYVLPSPNQIILDIDKYKFSKEVKDINCPEIACSNCWSIKRTESEPCSSSGCVNNGKQVKDASLSVQMFHIDARPQIEAIIKREWDLLNEAKVDIIFLLSRFEPGHLFLFINNLKCDKNY